MNLCELVDSGIYFKCQGCGKCCSNEQEGLVFIYWSDIRKIQNELSLPLEEIAQKYIKIVEYGYTLWDNKLQDSGKVEILPTLALNYDSHLDCIFLQKTKDKGLCQIYNSRPLQCELYPFWNVVMTADFQFKLAKMSCRGLNMPIEDSTFISNKEIQRLLLKERKIERQYILDIKKNKKDIFRVYPFLRVLKASSQVATTN